MKKKVVWIQVLYYVLFAAVFHLFMLFSSRLLDSADLNALSDVMGAFFVVVFVSIPLAVLVLSRFSLLKWYVDPFAALIVPIYIYVGMILTKMKRTMTFSAALTSVHESLGRGNAEGWLFIGGLFVFGILASFSIKRVKQNNISYQALALLCNKKHKK